MTEAPLTQTAQSTPTTPVQPTEMPAVVKESSQKDTPKQIKVSDDSQHNAETKSHEEKAESKQADPVFIRKGSAPAKKADAPEVQAPVLMANLGHQSMPQMSATVVPPKADFPTATVTAPKLLNGPRPTFPAGATALHLTSDTVVLNAKVMANGKVGDISVVRGHPVFVQAVKDAVKRWQYTPAQLDNKPTDATIEIVFKFGQGS
jgi:TonB family protein